MAHIRHIHADSEEHRYAKIVISAAVFVAVEFANRPREWMVVVANKLRATQEVAPFCDPLCLLTSLLCTLYIVLDPSTLRRRHMKTAQMQFSVRLHSQQLANMLHDLP